MKKTLLAILLLLPFLAHSQLNESYSDGDLTQTPAWTGDINSFMVNPIGQLQSNGTAVTGTTLQLATPSQTAVGAIWEFWANLRLATSSGNYADIYLIADTEDLKNSNTSGYFVRIGGTPDEVSLFRKDDGKTAVNIINGQDKTIASSNNNLVRVRVTRSINHEWELLIDLTGTGERYTSQGTATDATYTRSTYFGVLLRYSSTNSKNFYFDDFIISDTQPLVIKEVSVQSINQLELRFSKTLQQAEAEREENYTLNGSIKPTLAEVTAPGVVHLRFDQNFKTGANTVAVANLTDVYGNALAGPKEISFVYTPPAMLPEYNELLITEILADETPAQGLPAQEYIELYNPTENVLTLKGIRFSDATSTATLPDVQLLPKEYAVVVPNTQAANFTKYGNVVGISNFPGLNNSGELLQLRQPNGRLIYAVNYADTWYKDATKREGGWSLEMIDVSNPCAGIENWTASVNPQGGTPAQPNSVAATNPDNTPPVLINVSAIAPDKLLLSFNERLDSMQAANAVNYTIEPGIPVASVQVQGPLFTEVILTLASTLQERKLYTVSTQRMKDCAGNLSSQSLTATFALPSAPEPGDVVINEILFNPRPNGVDFVELVNRSDKYINLQSWQLTTVSGDTISNPKTLTTSNYVLAPGQYVVLTSNPENIRTNYPTAKEAAMLRMSSLPSFPDDAGTVVVLQPDKRVADQFSYTDEMHFNLLDDVNGISLERIRLEGQSIASNFHSAATTVFATPGYLNSQSQEGVALQRMFRIDPEVFSPDGDGYDDFTTINYSTDKNGFVASVTIFDTQGREIRKLVRNELLASTGFFRWDGLRQDGTKTAMGYYLLYIELFDLDGKKSVHKEKVVVGGKL